MPLTTLVNPYLQATFFLNYDDPTVAAFAETHTSGGNTPTEKAVALYYAVRDGFWYNPYDLNFNKTGLQASNLVQRKHGYCVEKAVLLATCARAVGIPSRLSFYNVKNHLATEKLEQVLGTNVLVFHGAAELYLNDKWLKLTPAFNATLCEKLQVLPLDFDGTNDAIFQEYDRAGNQFMAYLHDYGNFDDLPYDLFMHELRTHYPNLLDNKNFETGDRHYILA